MGGQIVLPHRSEPLLEVELLELELVEVVVVVVVVLLLVDGMQQDRQVGL